MNADEIAREHPLDECDCRDSRRDHINGVGRCTMPTRPLHHGCEACPKFRLCREYQEQNND